MQDLGDAMPQVKFSLVMPTYDDYDALWGTVQSNWELHEEYINEVIVVDNNPTGEQAETLKAFCQQADKTLYVPFGDAKGTAAAKNAAVANAHSDYVICVDSHVTIARGGVAALADFFKAHPRCMDLVQGPLKYDNRVDVSTHFSDVWSGEMWGQWDTDERHKSKLWFHIPAQGMGAFAVRKEAWLGFNPAFRGFGGEEWYIHEKYRRAGRQAWCVSGFKWLHKFARPNGVKYPIWRFDKVRNYCIGFQELGMSLEPIKAHFLDTGLITPEEWEAAKRGESRPPAVVSSCGGCGGGPPRFQTIDDWFNAVSLTKSDINEHCKTLRDLSAQCQVVVDCAMRHDSSTVALAAGKPAAMYVVAASKPGTLEPMASLSGKPITHIPGTSLTADVPEADLIFVDTEPHNYDHVYAELQRLKDKSRRWLVVHDTSAPFGETGQGGGPGVMYAVRKFIADNGGKWFTFRHDENNHGLTVLSCDERDMPPGLPPMWKMAINYAKSEAKDLTNGRKRVPLQVANERLAICTSNGGKCPVGARNIDTDRCTGCGCWLNEQPGEGPRTGKVHRPLDYCPHLFWSEYKGADCE